MIAQIWNKAVQLTIYDQYCHAVPVAYWQSQMKSAVNCGKTFKKNILQFFRTDSMIFH